MSLHLSEHFRVQHIPLLSDVQNLPREVSRSQVERPRPCEDIDLSDYHTLPTDPRLYSALTAEANNIADDIRLPPAQQRKWNEKLREINRALDRSVVGRGELVPFGSSSNGFSTKSSDLDLSFSVPVQDAVIIADEKLMRVSKTTAENRIKEEKEKVLFECIVKALVASGFGLDDIKSKFGARTPIICVLTDDFEMDIGISNQVAVENTRLLRTYSEFDERAARLGILIKYWAKKRRLSHAVNRVLCSYAFIVMTIRFLQEELILPNLQQDYPEDLPRRKVEDHDCSFETDLSLYDSMRGQNHRSLGELLLRFFHFYSFFDWRSRAVAIHQYDASKPKHYKEFLTIMDPFERTRNLGDTCSAENERTIINEIRKAYKKLCDGQSFASVCED